MSGVTRLLKRRANALLYINSKRVEVQKGQLSPVASSLLDTIRLRTGLTGTKRVCEEGGCGACTVLLGDATGTYKSVASCLLPTAAADLKHVVTIEGLHESNRVKSTRDLHPVAKAVAEAHGTQCGFCSPGVIMCLSGATLNTPSSQLSASAMEKALDGTLCRCTGYRPLATACEQVAELAKKNHIEPPIFPGELRGEHATLQLESEDGLCVWHRPQTLEDALALLAEHGKQAISAGGSYNSTSAQSTPDTVCGGFTDLSVSKQQRIEWLHAEETHRRVHYVSLDAIDSLKHTEVLKDGSFRIGAGVTIEQLRHLFKDHEDTSTVARELSKVLAQFANSQVRNVGTVGGSLCHASHLSDLVPHMCALGARVELSSADGTREMSCDEFILGNERTAINAVELLTALRIPALHADQHMFAFKTPFQRRQDAQAALNGCVLLRVQRKKVLEATVRFGALGVAGMRAERVEEALKGFNVSKAKPEKWRKLWSIVDEEGEQLASKSPHPSSEDRDYQKHLIRWSIEEALRRIDGGAHDVDHDLHLPASHSGSQTYVEDSLFPNRLHASAHLHASGDALYTADMRVPPGGLYAALVCADERGENSSVPNKRDEAG